MVGMMSVDEIAENVVVLDFDLPDEVLTQIQEVSDEIYYTMPPMICGRIGFGHI